MSISRFEQTNLRLVGDVSVFSGEFLKIHNDLTKPASKANEKPEPSPVLCKFINANIQIGLHLEVGKLM